MQSYWFPKQSKINIIYNISVITITNTMSIILANFGKYAISDCPFIVVFLYSGICLFLQKIRNRSLWFLVTLSSEYETLSVGYKTTGVQISKQLSVYLYIIKGIMKISRCFLISCVCRILKCHIHGYHDITSVYDRCQKKKNVKELKMVVQETGQLDGGAFESKTVQMSLVVDVNGWH